MESFVGLFKDVLSLVDSISLVKIFNIDLSLLDLLLGSIVVYVLCIVIYHGIIKKG